MVWTVGACVSDQVTFKTNADITPLGKGRTKFKLFQTVRTVCAKVPRKQ